MITKSIFSLVLVAVTFLGGCVAPQNRKEVRVNPFAMIASNEFFDVLVMPGCDSGGCNSFVLRIKNKTDKGLEINWNKTLYISRGQTSGGFMFEGVSYLNRNNPKTPDIVFGNSEFIKTIWPNNLVEFSSGKYGGWRHEKMPLGDNGIYLTVNIDGKEVSVKLNANYYLSAPSESISSQFASSQIAGTKYKKNAGEVCQANDDCSFGGLMCLNNICKAPW